LSRNDTGVRAAAWAGGQWVGAALGGAVALAAAVMAGLLTTELLMAPPAGELRELAVYLTLAGTATLAAGWAVLRALDRAWQPGIRAKTFIATMAANGVALLNVLIVAQLMFVSTAHDLRLLLALIAFSGVVSVCFTLWVATTVTGRISRVAGGLRALASGEYGSRVHIAGGDEVAALADDLNTLAGQLDEAERQRDAIERERRDLTAAISHDLRTPLASMRAIVEALDDEIVDDPAEVARYHGALRREIERLNRMVDDLLELARMDANALQLDLQPLGIDEIAADVVDAMKPQAAERRLSLRLVADTPMPQVLIDGARMERAIANLVRNALEHTPAGGRIELRVGRADGHVSLTVSDTGPGIDDASIGRIWERFYRADTSRNRSGSGDGAGLGLAIVRGIVEAHGGVVSAASTPGGGAQFVIALPV